MEVDTAGIGNYLDLGGEGAIQHTLPGFWLAWWATVGTFSERAKDGREPACFIVVFKPLWLGEWNEWEF